MRPFSLLAFAVIFLFFFGCIDALKSSFATKAPEFTGTATSIENQAIANCIALCQSEKSKGTDISKGPCLSNVIAPDWVCDIAHSPRTAIDDDPANQCPFFAQGNAHHFIEVSEDCGLIKKY